MNQPVHIFRKDARHLWPEILVSFALLGALLWVTPHNHGVPDPDVPWLYPLLGGFLKFLIPVTWLVLISRLVHDEPLVGDRQYWITRPYTWYGLLGAKLLFLIAFLYIPLFVVQAILLHHARLHPLLLGGPFLKNFFGITALIVLPLFAIAAVTSTFIRFALSVLAALVYLIVFVVVAALTMASKADVSAMNYVYETLLVAVPLAALLLQYRYRRTAVARTLLIALPVFLYFVAVLTPANALIGHEYSTSLQGLRATLDPDPHYQQQDTGEPLQFKKRIVLQLPIVLDGLPDKASLHSEHASIVIDGANGYHYQSGWLEAVSSLNPGPRPSRVLLQLPVDVYNRIKDSPVAFHITLGADRLEPAADYNVAATEAPFPIPGRGACRLASVTATANPNAEAPAAPLSCNFPFANPTPLAVQADATTGPCSTSANPATPGVLTPQEGFIAPSPAIPELDPVSSEDVPLQHLDPRPSSFCPGSKLHVSELKPTAKGSLQIDIPTLTPSAYAVRVTVPPEGSR